MLFVFGMLLFICYFLFMSNLDLKWEVRHYRRELKSAKKIERKLLDQLSEVDKMIIGNRPKRLGDDEWPDEIR